MDGYDATKYQSVEKKISELKMDMATNGALFLLKKDGATMGHFKSVNELFYFEAGRAGK